MPTLEEYYADNEDVRPKKKRQHPEWSLQTKLVGLVREFVDCEHEFACHDRSFDARGKQHLFEAERGVRKSWLDTELLIFGGMTFRCELKWLPNKVKDDDGQGILIARLNAIGHPAAWVHSLVGYLDASRAAGVPWRQGARARAVYLDAWLVATFGGPPKSKGARHAKPRPTKPTAAARRFADAFHRR